MFRNAWLRKIFEDRKECFGETPKPTRETRALPRETRGEIVALLQQLRRNNAAERFEKAFMTRQFLLPLLVIDAEQLDDAFVRNIQLSKIDIVRAGQPTDGRFDGAAGLFATIDNPFEHAHVVAETGPEKFSVFAFAEPIQVETER